MKKLGELGISPAPWKVGMDDIAMVFSGSQYPSLSTPHICEVDIVDDPEHKCNDVKLIAAAPELYDALQSLVEYIDRECIPCGENACELMTAAHNALAKAAGEEAK